MSTYQLIISIQKEHDFIFLAVIICRIFYIICGVFSFLILHKLDVFHVFLSIFFRFLESLIGRVIVDKNCMVVCVVLDDQGFQHLQVSVVLNVVVTDYYNTESSLVGISPLFEVFSPVVEPFSKVEEMVGMQILHFLILYSPYHLCPIYEVRLSISCVFLVKFSTHHGVQSLNQVGLIDGKCLGQGVESLIRFSFGVSFAQLSTLWRQLYPKGTVDHVGEELGCVHQMHVNTIQFHQRKHSQVHR